MKRHNKQPGFSQGKRKASSPKGGSRHRRFADAWRSQKAPLLFKAPPPATRAQGRYGKNGGNKRNLTRKSTTKECWNLIDMQTLAGRNMQLSSGLANYCFHHEPFQVVRCQDKALVPDGQRQRHGGHRDGKDMCFIERVGPLNANAPQSLINQPGKKGDMPSGPSTCDAKSNNTKLDQSPNPQHQA